MNQNKEQDFLDSPEFRKLISIIEQAAISAENAPFPLSDNKERLLQDTRTAAAESLKTFIREKMNGFSKKDLENAFNAAREKGTYEPYSHDDPTYREFEDYFYDAANQNEFDGSNPHIVFPPEEEINAIESPYRAGFQLAIERIKELNGIK